MFILILPSMFWGNSITHPVILQKAENPPSAILSPLRFSIRQVQEEEWLIWASYMSQTSIYLSEPLRNHDPDPSEAETGKIERCISIHEASCHSHPWGLQVPWLCIHMLSSFPKKQGIWELGYFLEQSKHWFRNNVIKAKPNVYFYAYFVKTLNNNLKGKSEKGLTKNRSGTLPPPLFLTNSDTPEYLPNISKGVLKLSKQNLS